MTVPTAMRPAPRCAAPWSRCGRCWMRWDWIRWPSRGPVPQARTATARVLDTLITEQLNARAEARKSRDFAKADAIRDALGAAGIAIEDGPQGSTWSLK